MVIQTLRVRLALFLTLFLWAGASVAQIAIAPDVTTVSRTLLGDMRLEIGLSAKTTYRVSHRASPPRIIVDLKDADLADLPLLQSPSIVKMTAGRFSEGWSRIILELTRPLIVQSAGYQTGGQGTVLDLYFKRGNDSDLASQISTERPMLADAAVQIPETASNKVLVALDPGHGGIDPGAIRDGVAEKNIALDFGLEVAALLRGTGRYDVILTRSDDHFVALSRRVRIAQKAKADIFISLHANTVTRGNASGATMYVLSDVASDPASAALAELENRADFVAGFDADAPQDDIASVLISLSRGATGARSRMAAKALVDSFSASVGVIQSHPMRSANFRVLRAHDMPSVLVELGFLSNAGDRARMQSPVWRASAADALLNALDVWRNQDRRDVMLSGAGQ